MIAGKDATAATFNVSRSPDAPAWTSVHAFSSRKRCTVLVTSTDEGFLVTAEPQIAGLPLGRLSDTIVLRFTNEGKTVLGGAQIPITLLHTHPDIQVKPASIYLGTHEGPRESTIRISVSAGQRLTIKSATVAEETAATVQIVEQGEEFVALKCTFTPSGEPGARTGRFSIHLSEPSAVEVCVPFVGFFKSQSP